MHFVFKTISASAISLMMLISSPVSAKEISFETSDNQHVYADIYLANHDKSAPLIILFHQARSNGRGEYKNIVPKLLEAGYSVLITDQRSGGNLFDGNNRTVSKNGKSTGYCEAYPDLTAALTYVKAQGITGPLYAFGSSYSAGLVVQLGAKNTEVLNGVIAFSPASGGPMANCSPNSFAENSKTPTMIVRPEKEMKVPSVQKQYDLFASNGHTVFIHEGGVHGASTLDNTRTNSDDKELWAAVFSFLQKNQ